MIVRALALCALLIGGATQALAARAESMRYLAAADSAFVVGNPRAAQVQLMNATDADPGNKTAWMYQARVALALRNGRAAEQALDRAIDAGVEPARTRHFRAHALILQRRSADALAAARADRIPARHRGYAARMRGRALAELGELRGAAREFGKAIAIIPLNAPLWVDIARYRLLSGERLGAIRASDHALALDARNVDALILKGELVREQYGLVAALKWFDKALAIDRFDIAAQLERAATLGDLGRTQEMLAATREVQALDAANPRAFHLQAALAARARNFKLADKLIDQVGGALDAVPAMLLLKGAVAYQLGYFAEATTALTSLVEAQPNNISARQLLAAAEWRSGDFDAVVATLQPIVDAATADSYTLTLLARAYEAQGDRATAAVYLDQAANDRSAAVWSGFAAHVDEGEQDGADARVAAVRRLLAAGNVRQGLDMALTLQRDNPGAPDAHMLAGDAWSAADRPPEAVEAYRRAANLRFSEQIALRLVGALSRAGRGADAVRVLDLFLSQKPMSVRARLLQADLLMARSRFADAAHILEDVRSRIGAQDVAVASNLAWCYFQTSRTDEAINIASEAYRLAPANPRISHGYGWILHKSGSNPRAALALLRQAATQAPDWALARRHLAEAEAVHGRRTIG